MKLKTRFLLFLIAGVLLPVVVISLIVISNVRDQALVTFQKNSQAEITHIDTAFSQYLNGLSDDALFLANTEMVNNLDRNVVTYMDKTASLMTPDKNQLSEQVELTSTELSELAVNLQSLVERFK